MISNSGNLTIGDNFNISANSKIVCRNSITIGRDCLLSWDCLLMDSDWHLIYNELSEEHINSDKAIVMENHIWVGCNTIILKGAEIPKDCVIAAGSIVSGKLTAANTIY